MLINFRRVSEFEEIPVGNYQEYESNAMYVFVYGFSPTRQCGCIKKLLRNISLKSIEKT